mmetsp:Transcript_59844/g.69928  ORF Transcript_59844/g.69928 Transcript_59844/m.69928 type:complete len:246 (-) Transcript_59844:77-814(-)
MANRLVVVQPTLSILSRATTEASRFPIHRIYCVGRNYLEHAIEMGGNPTRDPPCFFQKPADAATDTSTTDNKRCIIPYPPMTNNLHHEIELVVAIGTPGRNISKQDAKQHIFGYAIGCDLTRRDLQAKAKELRRPWDDAKGFDYSAPCSSIVPCEELKDFVGDAASVNIKLEVNGELRQESSIAKMIWDVPEILSCLSKYYTLKAGDLILTGTPAGVGPLDVGDVVKASCDELPDCIFEVGPMEL